MGEIKGEIIGELIDRRTSVIEMILHMFVTQYRP